MTKQPCRMKAQHGCEPCRICRQESHIYYTGFTYCDLCWKPKPKEIKGPNPGSHPIPGGMRYANTRR